ncbi:hypothetical protein QBC47DRAFT_223176 [Echria macrotheca]|uniref:Uncharacterized protein n=1 Tax=Echria macrotheca TaxID=438768 RepID=A0AAJ0BCB3_9PEZI|nr:hypothetical protein QBC47DRAFT_223176 [Echria macrotheca]
MHCVFQSSSARQGSAGGSGAVTTVVSTRRRQLRLQNPGPLSTLIGPAALDRKSVRTCRWREEWVGGARCCRASLRDVVSGQRASKCLHLAAVPAPSRPPHHSKQVTHLEPTSKWPSQKRHAPREAQGSRLDFPPSTVPLQMKPLSSSRAEDEGCEGWIASAFLGPFFPPHIRKHQLIRYATVPSAHMYRLEESRPGVGALPARPHAASLSFCELLPVRRWGTYVTSRSFRYSYRSGRCCSSLALLDVLRTPLAPPSQHPTGSRQSRSLFVVWFRRLCVDGGSALHNSSGVPSEPNKPSPPRLDSVFVSRRLRHGGTTKRFLC